MSAIQDQYHGDPTLTRLLSALADRPQALEAVKHASFDADAAERLPDSAFAWESERRFPIHTREDTIASLVYRSKHAGAVPRFVDEQLAEAAEVFGVSAELFASNAPRTKIASTVEYAVPDEERLPLGSVEQVKVAEHVLLRDGKHLPPDVRAAAFAKVAAAAIAYGMAVDPAVGAYAGLNACNTQLLRDRIGARAATTKVAACITAYDTLDLALQALPPVIHDRPTLMKLAEKLEALDTAAGLTADYGRRIFDPMKTVFNAGEKLAMPSDLTADGMNVAKMMNLPPQVWDTIDVPELGKLAAAGDSMTFKQVYETLPLDIKMVLKAQFGR